MKTENTEGKINQLLTEQFAIDYGCSVIDFCCKETLVTELRPNEQARKREELGVLSMLSYRGKLVIALPRRIRLKASANALLEEAHADVVV